MIARGRDSKSWERLLRQKLGEEECFSGNAATQRGHELEPKARSRFESKAGVKVRPACLQSNKHEWLRCSVDGLSSDGSRVLEIKCGDALHSRISNATTLPRDLFSQLQHILAVANLPAIDLFCHWPGRADLHYSVPRDNEWIDYLISVERDFWLQVCRYRG